MAAVLQSKGFTLTESDTRPDMIIVNTCCVTSRAEGKSRRLISGLISKYPHARFVATGCLAQLNPASLENLSQNLTCLGLRQKDRFNDSMDKVLGLGETVQEENISSVPTIGDLNSTLTPGRARAALKVQDGCDQKCSYCIVPYTRGPSRSMPMERVIGAAMEMEALGVKEITLSGIHIGRYGKDLPSGPSLEDLIEKLLAETTDVRFRISSYEPQEISPRILDMIGELQPQICRHLHIPVQSASDKILKSMGRPYSSAGVKDLLAGTFDQILDICVGLDLMVGFPGEKEADFQMTLDLVRQYPVAYLHVFPFSPRPGTPAASMKGAPPESVVKERVKILRAESRRLREAFYRRNIGKVFQAVIERVETESGVCVARTDNYTPVAVKGSGDQIKGEFMYLKITGVKSSPSLEVRGRGENSFESS